MDKGRCERLGCKYPEDPNTCPQCKGAGTMKSILEGEVVCRICDKSGKLTPWKVKHRGRWRGKGQYSKRKKPTP